MPPVASPASTWWRKASKCVLPSSRGTSGAPRRRFLMSSDGARQHDAAGLDEVGVVGEVERHRRVLLHHQHADALLLVHRAQDAEQLLHDERREAEGGLVQQHELGPQHERARHREHLLLAARERAGLLRAPLLEAREVAVHALQVRLHGVLVLARVGAEAQVLLGGQVDEGAAAVGHMGDAQAHDVLGGAAVDALAGEADLALACAPCRRARAAWWSCPRRWRRAGW